jgi:hypothetical protein
MLFQKWWFIRALLKYGSPLISPLEKPAIEKRGAEPPENPCVFIIGPPRSGSTIVYQIITSLLNVSYMDNLSNLARNNPYAGLRLSQIIYPTRAHKSYTSSFGRTSQGGLHAPAEPLFFYKWFPKERHYTTLDDLSEQQVTEFRKTLYAMINRVRKPLVIKNLSFSLRLQVLRVVVPDARYIVVRRNPLYTAQSILQAMRKNNQPMDRVWGILPRNHEELQGLEPHEMVVRQVNLIEKQIHDDLKGIPSEKILYVDYEKLGTALELVLGDVMTLCGPGVKRRPTIPLPDISVKNRITLPEEEIEILKSHIQPMNWELQNI